ncbi:DUF6705 family protein [Mucilaginibacter glaciei]|uniref:DUF6705 domain-containing protein n=1 Tax=Mucilaginibacter glaciei TaxID=2772109 RepID=A0A926S6V6_9SPHI|nr:DUF6705 family protein [Mucilaginibacter glaciei]MBD1394091.1 hypothetical protein [Mucilaginibacter glaciei]
MKNILLILLFGFICNTLKANNLITDTIYYHDENLRKFEGTWQYSDNNVTFKVTLKVRKVYSELINAQRDDISGYHLYIKNNHSIQDAFDKQKTLTNGSYTNDINKNILQFTFKDLGRQRGSYAVVELLPDGTLKWHLKNRGGLGLIIDGKERSPYDRKFYVPTDLILSKVH